MPRPRLMIPLHLDGSSRIVSSLQHSAQLANETLGIALAAGDPLEKVSQAVFLINSQNQMIAMLLRSSPWLRSRLASHRS